MILTHEWQEYDMDYQKAVQDIRTKDGKEYLNCWPNAGKWCVLSNNKQSDIPDADVTHVRLNESWMSEEQEAIAEGRTPSVGVIGHINHEKTTIAAAMTQMLIDRANEPDMQNIGPEKGITIELSNPYPPDITDRYVDVVGPYHKKHKPNKGLKIGSYRYKGK